MYLDPASAVPSAQLQALNITAAINLRRSAKLSTEKLTNLIYKSRYVA